MKRKKENKKEHKKKITQKKQKQQGYIAALEKKKNTFTNFFVTPSGNILQLAWAHFENFKENIYKIFLFFFARSFLPATAQDKKGFHCTDHFFL